MPRPAQPPLGVQLAHASKQVSRAFDEALLAAGGSRPVWLVLMALKQSPGASQSTVAAAVGIRGATLTHHLDTMERQGLVTRRRDPGNRRAAIVELTAEGDEKFTSLRRAAVAFDKGLRKGMNPDELDLLRQLLTRLAANVEGGVSA